MIKEKKAQRLKRVDASDLILTQVSLTVDDDLRRNLKDVELTPLNPLLSLSQVFPHVEQNRLHKTISVVLDDIIDIVQRAWKPRTRKKKGEIRSLLWIKVRIFFPLLPSLINAITGFQNTSRAS
jgi:hypothetical protein